MGTVARFVLQHLFYLSAICNLELQKEFIKLTGCLEWKIDEDVKNDTHRHLSGLYGWFPGYMIANTFNNETVVEAVTTMLWSRGVGIIDSDAGWEKVWRSACWGRLNNTDQA